MISILICSRTQDISDDLFQNIKNTIGCAYELVVIDNSQNQYSIFEAYNLGIQKSTNEYLCFLHDDILFHTPGWGNIIIDIFKKEKETGLIGVAGAKFKTKTPSAWWHTPKDQMAMHIIQHFNDGTMATQSFGFENNSLQEVVTIDGVFMALRKDTKITFNPEMKGFHNYDLNLSFECIKNGYKIMVTDAITIEHFSTGTINDSWVESAYKIHDLYKAMLPLSCTTFTTNKKFEVANSIRFINRCLQFNNNTKAFNIWKKLVIMHPYSKFHFTFFGTFLKNCLGRTN